MLRESIRTAHIALGANTSQAIPLRGKMVVGLRIPAAITGTALTFLGSEEFAGTYAAIYDSDNNQVSATVAADRFVGLSGPEADAVSASPFIKLVSNAAGPGYELAARDIVVVMK